MARLFLIILSFWLSTEKPTTKQYCQKLTVNIEHVRNSDGHILVAIFGTQNGFPDKTTEAFRRFKVKAEAGTTQLTIGDLPFGTYALSLLHDENSNQKMDYSILQIPKEGYGFSRDAMGTFGPPSFDKAKFEVNQKEMTVTLSTHYIL